MDTLPRKQPRSDELIERLEGLIRETPLAEGEVAYAEGEASSAVYILRSGSLRLTALGGANSVTLEPNALFGITAAVLGARHGETAVALTDCTIGVVLRDDFMKLLERNFETCQLVLDLLSKDVNISYDRLRSLAEPVVRPRKPRP